MCRHRLRFAAPLGLCPACPVSPPSRQGPRHGLFGAGSHAWPTGLPASSRPLLGRPAGQAWPPGTWQAGRGQARSLFCTGSAQPLRPQWPEQAAAGKGSPWRWVWVGGGGVTNWAPGGRMVYKPAGVLPTHPQPEADFALLASGTERGI